MLILFVAILALEFCLFLSPVWAYRSFLAVAIVPAIGFSAAGLVVSHPNLATGILALVAVFRVINMLRVVEGRMHERYLRQAVRRTSLALGFSSMLLIALHVYMPVTHIKFVRILGFVQLAVAALLLLVTLRNIYKSRLRVDSNFYSDDELPTVTVAIPARNETPDLEACLTSLIASNYPKLEIIVLDDCSQDKTSEVIKAYAQSGVRFIKGADPDDHWLAKNQAYDRLADEASGKYILFCGVDTRFGVAAIRNMITVMLNRQKSMISVMPRRGETSLGGALLQPMRYWWELALPRRLFNSPPVLSTCWIIDRKVLKKLGAFDAVSRSIVPEAFFARELVKTDGYSFLHVGKQLAIESVKPFRAQYQTALRVRYPQTHRRPEQVMLLLLAEFTLLLGPFLLVIGSIINGQLNFPAIVACLLLITTHTSIIRIYDPNSTLFGLVNMPLATVLELIVLLLSFWRYEFGVVEWKGRNICVPVMHVYPKLARK